MTTKGNGSGQSKPGAIQRAFDWWRVRRAGSREKSVECPECRQVFEVRYSNLQVTLPHDWTCSKCIVMAWAKSEMDAQDGKPVDFKGLSRPTSVADQLFPRGDWHEMGPLDLGGDEEEDHCLCAHCGETLWARHFYRESLVETMENDTPTLQVGAQEIRYTLCPNPDCETGWQQMSEEDRGRHTLAMCPPWGGSAERHEEWWSENRKAKNPQAGKGVKFHGGEA